MSPEAMIVVGDYVFPPDRWYDAREHLWLLPERVGGVDGLIVRVGVDAMGQEALGAVVYAELGEAGACVRRGEALGSLEAEKMVRPVLAPVSGTIVGVNGAVVASPRLLNSQPYDAGWLVRIRATRWNEERAELLHGDIAVAAWAKGELERR